MELPPDVEKQLADMSETDWEVLVSRLRAPDLSEAFRAAASKYVDGDRLEAVVACANLSAFVNDAGEIDEAKVEQRLRAAFGLPEGPRHQNFGQYTPPPPQPGPGDRGDAEARKRFSGQPQPPTTGRAGYEKALRRHPNKTEAN